MSKTANQSEATRLRQQIADEYESVQRGLTSYAIVSRHLFIAARMSNIAACQRQLEQLVGYQQSVEIAFAISQEAIR